MLKSSNSVSDIDELESVSYSIAEVVIEVHVSCISNRKTVRKQAVFFFKFLPSILAAEAIMSIDLDKTFVDVHSSRKF